MLDRKKRNIYIGLIAVSALGMIFVWFFNFSPTDSVNPNQMNQGGLPENTSIPESSESAGSAQLGTLEKGEFPMPGVFPSAPDYDFSVLESSVYKNLKDYKALTVDEEDLGREDPFKPTQ